MFENKSRGSKKDDVMEYRVETTKKTRYTGGGMAEVSKLTPLDLGGERKPMRTIGAVLKDQRLEENAHAHCHR